MSHREMIRQEMMLLRLYPIKEYTIKHFPTQFRVDPMPTNWSSSYNFPVDSSKLSLVHDKTFT